MARSLTIITLILSGLAVTVLQARQPAPPPKFNFGPVGAIQRLTADTFVIPGAGGNTTAFVTARGVVLVDTKTPNNGQAILNRLKTVTDRPVIAIVNTHVHFDHTGSNAFFPEQVEIVAHVNAANGMTKDPAFQTGDAKRGLADRTYADRLTLFEGADAVDLYHVGRAHTDGDTFVVFRRARAMAAGDAFPGPMQPIIDINNGGSGVEYPETIAKAASAINNVDHVVPGHAPPTNWQALVDYGEFNKLFLEHARRAVAAGQTPVQAMESFKAALPDQFKSYPLGAGMMTGPGGNFEPIFRELQRQ